MCFSGLTGNAALEARDWAQSWRVAYSKPRQEKALAREFQRAGVSYFLPLWPRVTAGVRQRTIFNPLYPSYIFFAGDEASWLAALKTKRIVQLLAIGDGEERTLVEELRSLEVCLRRCPPSLQLHNGTVQGERRLLGEETEAPFYGTILNTTYPLRVWVGVSALGGGVVFELERRAVS